MAWYYYAIGVVVILVADFLFGMFVGINNQKKVQAAVDKAKAVAAEVKK
jgi:uncharacterized membrane-anchored protein YhcB (DUF1043 family)